MLYGAVLVAVLGLILFCFVFGSLVWAPSVVVVVLSVLSSPVCLPACPVPLVFQTSTGYTKCGGGDELGPCVFVVGGGGGGGGFPSCNLPPLPLTSQRCVHRDDQSIVDCI